MELPLSLSIVTAEGMTVKMLERQTALPASKTRIFTTKKPVPTAVLIELVTGERFDAKENRKLTRIRIGGIKKTFGDVVRIAVRVDVKEDGQIEFEAFDYGSHHKKTRILDASWLPDEAEITRSVSSAKEVFEEESLLRERNRIISRAKATVLTVRSIKRADRARFTSEQWNEIRQKTKDLEHRTKRARAENLGDVDAKVISEEIASVNKLVHSVSSGANNG